MLNEAPAHGRVGINPEHRQIVNMLSGTKDNFRLGSWNVGSMHRRSGEVVEVLERRKVDVCCVQEVRWSGESARLLTGRDSQYKFFWTGGSTGFGGVGILVGGKWIDKVIEIKHVNHRLMMLKILVGKRTVSIVSCYAPHKV